jgi:pSer/pThr/pTyr-binding forkhead associated (FHA) protein
VHRRGYAFQAQARVIPPAAPLPATAQATTGAATACSLVASSHRYPLLRGDNIVGRDPAAHVWLDSASVSRRHACIRVEGDRVTIEDLESKNGTRVSGVPVMAPTTLADGDQLQFGSIAAVFSAWAADATITEGGS